jgi:diacylglycerol kinase (ATP)
MTRSLAIVNPAAGSGRCGKLAGPILERLRQSGIEVEAVFTGQAGEATQLARKAYAKGVRTFLAAGGDGTIYEIINGLFPLPSPDSRITLGFLPLGTGNSFLRDFTDQGLDYAVRAITERRRRPCDLLRLVTREGDLYYINLLSVGFTAIAGELTNRRYKRYGEIGYLAAIFQTWLQLKYPVFPLRLNGNAEFNRQPCIYLTFSNSKYTGGKLMIAPFADTSDGQIELTRVGPLGRWDFVRTFPKIFSGKHMEHPLISRESANQIEFDLHEAVDVMIDGEVVRCHPLRIETLPAILEVIV